jgi:hypothetical protein
MKMTVTLEEKDVIEIVREYVANHLECISDDIKKITINVKMESRGDQRDSYNVAVFQNVTVDIQGKLPRK